MTRNSQVIRAGFIVGTLDITATCLHYFIKTGKGPALIFKYIASAVLGKAAFTGGANVIACGLLMHYAIAFAFTIFFFWLFEKRKIFAQNPLLTGIFYGSFTWLMMNLVMVPLTRANAAPFTVQSVVINLLILIACIGIPLALMAAMYQKLNHEGPKT
jgi:hypothetical protein